MNRWYMINLLIFSLSLLLNFGCNYNKMDKIDQGPKTPGTDTLTAKANKIDIEYLMGQFDPSTHPDFEEIPEIYADRSGLFLRRETLQWFIKMYDEAKKVGINLQIRSATRNFDYQKGIWENKWNGVTILSDGTNVARDILSPEEKALKILLYSSMPGTSRHHWGTDIDLNAFNNSWFEKGEGLEIYKWLEDNAHLFGFCQPYSPLGPDRPKGYQEEKWHWSYMPLSKTFTKAAELKLLDEYIVGFTGAEVAVKIKVVKNYVLGINKNCK